MLRISVVTRGRTARLKLEGRVAGPWVGELSQVVAGLGPAALTIDMSGVSFIDASGLDLLRSLGAKGVKLAGGSPFILGLVGGGLP